MEEFKYQLIFLNKKHTHAIPNKQEEKKIDENENVFRIIKEHCLINISKFYSNLMTSTIKSIETTWKFIGFRYGNYFSFFLGNSKSIFLLNQKIIVLIIVIFKKKTVNGRRKRNEKKTLNLKQEKKLNSGSFYNTKENSKKKINAKRFT